MRAESGTAAVGAGGRLATVWSAARGLGDGVLLALVGPHIYDVSTYAAPGIDELETYLAQEDIDLDLEMRLREVRDRGWPADPDALDALERHAAGAVGLEQISRSHRDLLQAIRAADAPFRVRMGASRALIRPLAEHVIRLPEDFALAHLRLCAVLSPRWAEDLLDEVLAPDRAVPLAEAAPRVVAACLDLVPAVAWRAAQGSLSIDDWTEIFLGAGDPEVVVAFAALVSRLAHVEAERVYMVCAHHLARHGADELLLQLSPEGVRRFVRLADNERGDGPLTGLLADSSFEIEAKLPADVLIDVERLRMRYPHARRRSRYNLIRWQDSRDPGVLSALLRVVADGNVDRDEAVELLAAPYYDRAPSSRPLSWITPDILSQLPIAALRDLHFAAEFLGDDLLLRFTRQQVAFPDKPSRR